MESNRFRNVTAASSAAMLLALVGCGDREPGQRVTESTEQSATAVTQARGQARETLAEARKESLEAIQEARQESQEALREVREQLRQAEQRSREAFDEAEQESRQAYDEANKEAREQVAELREESREANREARQAAAQAREESLTALQEARDNARQAQRVAEQARADARKANEALGQSDVGETRDPTATMGAAPQSQPAVGAQDSASLSDPARDANAAMGASGDPQPHSIGSAIDDTEITAKVNTGLSVDRDLSAMDIEVETREGVVTLAGRAPSEEAKRRAEEIARHVQDVQSVRNELTVDGSV
jgi:osmotically-inducible protein OsmY